MTLQEPQTRPVTEVEYSDLLHRSPVPVVVHGDDSRVVDANQAFADLIGYPLDDVIGLHAHDVIHPDNHGVRDVQAAQLLDGTHSTLTVTRRLVRKDGSMLWAKVHKSSVRLNDRVVVMVFFEDWTDQHWEASRVSDS